MERDVLLEEIQRLLGKQALGTPLSREEEERLDGYLECLNHMVCRSAGHAREWESSPRKTVTREERKEERPPSVKQPAAGSGTKDFLLGMGAAMICLPLLCMLAVAGCAAGQWLAEQLTLPVVPLACTAACMLPGALLMWGAKGMAHWFDRTVLWPEEEEL